MNSYEMSSPGRVIFGREEGMVVENRPLSPVPLSPARESGRGSPAARNMR